MPKEAPIKKTVPPKKPAIDPAHGELKALLEKNLKWSQLIHDQNKRLLRKMNWMIVGNYLRLVLIVVPLIVAFVYLPPFISEAYDEYQKWRGSGEGIEEVQEVFSNLTGDQIQSILNKLPR